MSDHWRLFDHGQKIDYAIELLEQIVSGQASIDAATAQIIASQGVAQTATSTLQADVTAISAELSAAGAVDTTALDAAVAASPAIDSALTSGVNAVTALATPAAPAPAGGVSSEPTADVTTS